MIKITTEKAVNKLKQYIDECDADDLARLLGEIFGGECFQDPDDLDIYNFEPNEYYGGETF